MNKRPALIGIMVMDPEAVEDINSILHEYRDFIIGRMGIPCRDMGVSLLSIALTAPQNAISAISGKLGAVKGVSVKTITHKMPEA